MKRLSLWLLDKRHFTNLVKALTAFGDVDLVVSITRLPADARGEAHITGWVPAADEGELRKTAEAVTEGQCEISFSDPKPGEEVPSLMRHHRFLRPFQKLVQSFGIPSYGEIDPTPFMVLAFMLVFCFMFADVGHGLVVTLVGILAYVMEGKLEQKSDILGYVLESGGLLIACGVSGVIGGLLVGEVFGYHVDFLPFRIVFPDPLKISLPFRPIDSPLQMFRLSLLIGTVDTSFGLTLNIVNRLMARKLRAAFFEALCWIWFYLGMMYSVFRYGFNFLSLIGDPMMMWGIALPLSLMLVGKISLDGLEGAMTFVENIISTISNTVSYLRILALSLAHSIISSLILEVGGHNAAIAIVGSLPTIALEGLIVFIHSTRLMWVEWFSKFYSAKGTAFRTRVLFDWEIYGLEPPYLEALQVTRSPDAAKPSSTSE